MLTKRIETLNSNQANEDLENFVNGKEMKPILQKEELLRNIAKLN